MGSGKWDPHYGYGFKLGPKGRGLSGDDFWKPLMGNTPGRDFTIQVHKVHGSLHFTETSKGISLKQRPYGNTKAKTGDMNFTIIPPESSKSYDGGLVGLIMKNAYKSLRKATRLVVIGYSLPAMDQHAESLLRFGIKKGALDSLVIVNPDRSARIRLRSAVQGGLKSDTRILSFDYLEEFVHADQSVWKV